MPTRPLHLLLAVLLLAHPASGPACVRDCCAAIGRAISSRAIPADIADLRGAASGCCAAASGSGHGGARGEHDLDDMFAEPRFVPSPAANPLSTRACEGDGVASLSTCECAPGHADAPPASAASAGSAFAFATGWALSARSPRLPDLEAARLAPLVFERSRGVPVRPRLRVLRI